MKSCHYLLIGLLLLSQPYFLSLSEAREHSNLISKSFVGSASVQVRRFLQSAETTDEPIMPNTNFDPEVPEVTDEPVITEPKDNPTPEQNSTNENPPSQPADPEIKEPVFNNSGNTTIVSLFKEYWIYLVVCLILVCFLGLISGLTVGYLTLDEDQIENKMKNGTDEEKRHATEVMPILAKNYQLLSTLLILNTIAQQTLPIILGNVVPAWVSVVISTLLVLFFGEIIPQIYCTGPNQMKIASKMASFVKFLMLICFISGPISSIFKDFFQNRRRTTLLRKDLESLVELQEVPKLPSPKFQKSFSSEVPNINQNQKNLTSEQAKLVNSIIDLKDCPIISQMKPIDQIFMLSSSIKINRDFVKRIAKNGLSNIPVYENYDKNKIVGILKTKSLLDYQDKYEGQTIGEAGLQLMEPLIVSKDITMLELLTIFEERKTTMALVSNNTIKAKVKNAIFFSRRNLMIQPNGVPLSGLISLKDVVEEMASRRIATEEATEAGILLKSAEKNPSNKIVKNNFEESVNGNKPENSLNKPLLRP